MIKSDINYFKKTEKKLIFNSLIVLRKYINFEYILISNK